MQGRAANEQLVLAELVVVTVGMVVEDTRQRSGYALRTDEGGGDTLNAVQIEDELF